MKKTLLTIAIALASLTVSAQKGFYVSLAGGPTFKAGTKVLSERSGLTGSYGEGFQGQLRGGYFFNDKIGIDLGVGYLHGAKQQIIETPASITGSARAYGLALTGVYNVLENVYVRGGLLTKLGGKTLVKSDLDATFPTAAGPALLNVKFTRDNKGSFPLGFIGALGVKFDLASNFGMFVELDYQGINVPAKKSVLGDLSASLDGRALSKAQLQGAIGQQLAGLLQIAQQNPKDPRLAALPTIATLNNLISDEITYVDNPTPGKPESKSTDAPYSSFGFSIGVTYHFGSK